MARNPIEIPIGVDAGAYEKGVASGIIKPTKDAEKALRELAETRGPEGLEASMRDAQKQTERLKDETRRSADAIERDWRSSYRSAKQSSEDATRKMRDDFRDTATSSGEASAELKQNLGETFSSFRGDLEDLPQIAQDVFGGMAGSVGTLVGSIGLAGVAGAIGLVIGGLQEAQREQERNTAQANEWAEAYMQAGGRILSTTSIVSNGQAILRDRMDELKENTEAWGVSQETALAAMAGSPAAIEEVRTSLANMTAEMERQQRIEMKDEWAEYSSELTTLQGRVYDGTTAFEQMTARMDEGAAKADAYSFFLRDLATTTEGATQKVDEFGDTVVSLPDGKQIYIDAETGRATDDVNAIESKVYGIQDKTIQVDADVSRAIREIGRLNGQTVYVNVDARGNRGVPFY